MIVCSTITSSDDFSSDTEWDLFRIGGCCFFDDFNTKSIRLQFTIKWIKNYDFNWRDLDFCPISCFHQKWHWDCYFVVFEVSSFWPPNFLAKPLQTCVKIVVLRPFSQKLKNIGGLILWCFADFPRRTKSVYTYTWKTTGLGWTWKTLNTTFETFLSDTRWKIPWTQLFEPQSCGASSLSTIFGHRRGVSFSFFSNKKKRQNIMVFCVFNDDRHARHLTCAVQSSLFEFLGQTSPATT